MTLINTHVINISQDYAIIRNVTLSFDAHKEVFVIKVLTQNSSIDITFHFDTHWQPLLLLVNNPVRQFILMMIYSSMTFVVSMKPF